MKTIALTDVIQAGPCEKYDPGTEWRAKLEAVAAQREQWNAREIITAGRENGFADDDILWLVLRTELLDDAMLRLLACDFAERALLAEREAGREPHADSWAAVEVTRRYAAGEATCDELAAARAAADAAWAAANAANAARAANAAWAAWAAADAANAADAAWAAARAAWAAERRWQLKRVRQVCLAVGVAP